MMTDLAKEYGKHKAFKDEELFDKITDLTYPEVREFFRRYVEGKEPLPMADIFLKAGIIYELEGEFSDFTIGLTENNFGIDMDRGVIYIQNEEELDEFGKLLGLKDGDIIKGINGELMPELGPLIMNFFEEVISSMEEGKEYTMTVLRPTEDGAEEEVTLSATTIKINRIVPFAISPIDEPTEQQLKVRSAWLGIE
jgi:predicted metalloprotease with PDZ domain